MTKEQAKAKYDAIEHRFDPFLDAFRVNPYSAALTLLVLAAVFVLGRCSA